MAKLYLVKLGGSVITDINRPNTAKYEAISRLMLELKAARAGKKLIVGHGAGSFGHIVARKFKVNDGINGKGGKRGAVHTQFSALELHTIMMKRAMASGLNVFSFPPSAAAIAKNKRIVSWDISPVKEALHYGFIPMVHGDLVMDKAQGFSVASTEEVFRYLALKLKPYRVIVGTDVDGIYAADPKSDKGAGFINRVDKRNINEVLPMVGASTKVDVTGGMRSKLQYLYEISKLTGAPCQIINANKKGQLQNALNKISIGTLVTAR